MKPANPFDPRVPESRTRTTVCVGLGLLAGAFLEFLWIVFAGAAAGSSGATPYFSNSFVPVSLGVFGLYAVITVVLYVLRRDASAVLVAWLPVLLILVVMPMLHDIARWLGAK